MRRILRRRRCLDQPQDLSWAGHALLGLVGEDHPAVHQHVEHTRPGEAHLRREVQLFLDFPLEAHGLEQDADSSEAVLDLDVHVFSLSSSDEGRPQ